MDLRLERLTKEREADWLALMGRDEHGSQCWCVAWWVPTWDAYVEQSPDQRRAMRDDLFARGAHDGYLAYAEGAPVAWVQAGPRDNLPKIAGSFALDDDPHVWALSCFIVLAPYRGRGLARQVFSAVLEDLRARGVAAVEGYPLHGSGHDDTDVWTGPESLYVAAGFREVTRDPRRVVYRLDLAD